MVPARPSPWFKAIFAFYVERVLARSFASVGVGGLELLRDVVRERPVVVVSNHTSWWDPMLLIYVTIRVLHVDAYALMRADELKRRPFLGRLGGFGVDLGSRMDRARVVRYGAKVLQSAGTLVWVFPQGRERPVTAPLEFAPGAAAIARRAPHAVVVPAAMRYEHMELQQPRAFLSFGAPMTPSDDIESMCAAQREAVQQELARIDAALVRDDYTQTYAPMLARRSPSRPGLLERALAVLTRYPEAR